MMAAAAGPAAAPPPPLVSDAVKPTSGIAEHLHQAARIHLVAVAGARSGAISEAVDLLNFDARVVRMRTESPRRPSR